MKIAVCEDNEKDRKQLCAQLAGSMERLNVDADVEVFGTAEELLTAADKTFYSLFFLDILLPGLSGVEAAMKLRRAGCYSPIAFTTVTKDYLTTSYSVWAVNYLVKPFSDKDVDETLARALKVLEREEKTLEITVARHTEYIPFSDIYYIEGNNRNCIVHTRTGNYNPYDMVQKMAERLDDSRFFYSHRSYIINLDHVLEVQHGKAAMRDDALLPIRRGWTKEVRRAWEDRRFAVVDGRE